MAATRKIFKFPRTLTDYLVCGSFIPSAVTIVFSWAQIDLKHGSKVNVCFIMAFFSMAFFSIKTHKKWTIVVTKRCRLSNGIYIKN